VRLVPLIKKLPGKVLVAALIIVAIAVLVPVMRHSTTGQASRTTQVSQAADTSPASCRGVTPATFTAQGFITNPARTQGGHTWWRNEQASGSVCVGTVVEWVQYNVTMTKTWRVVIYTAQQPNGQTVASRTFTLRPGWYRWSFRIRQAFPGLSAVCVTADDSFGKSCVHFG
jgi:hypothetical protein